MRGIRDHQLTFSPGIVAYLKMLVMLGTIRHELAIRYDLRANVQHFFTRYMRQRALALADPRQAMDRFYEASVRIRRAVRFFEFIESQESFIVEAQSTLLGFRRRMQAVRRRLVQLGVAVLVVGAVLYFVLREPDETRRMLPRRRGLFVGPLRAPCHPPAPDRPDRARHAPDQRRRLTGYIPDLSATIRVGTPEAWQRCLRDRSGLGQGKQAVERLRGRPFAAGEHQHVGAGAAGPSGDHGERQAVGRGLAAERVGDRHAGVAEVERGRAGWRSGWCRPSG